MTKHVETKISEINDADFQTLIAELCECLGWNEHEFENKTLANLFMAIVIQQKRLDLRLVMIDTVLARKVKNLALGSVVYGVCHELANRNCKAMDDMLGKSVFALIKQCYKAVNPRLSRAKKPTSLQRKHHFETKLIKRRRSNGSYV